MLRSLLNRFRLLDRKLKIAVISAIVVFCCIIPYIGTSLAPSSPEEEPTPTLIEKISETELVEPTATTEPTEVPTEIPTETSIPTPTDTPLPYVLPESAKCLESLTYVGDASVNKVVDGDTIDVIMTGESEPVPVRYIGIDSPERDDDFFTESNNANKELVEGKQVQLFRDVSEFDRFDRYLFYVIADGKFVNYEMVKAGYANAVEYPPDTNCADTFYTAEDQAIQDKVGSWAIPVVIVQTTQPTSQLIDSTPTDTEGPSQPGEIVITKIFYDGVVSRQEPDEYVEIKNTGSSPVNLSGWLLHDEGNKHRFRFPSFSLEPGKSCRIYTNENHPDWCGFNFGEGGSAIWNNSGDCANLLDSNGNLVVQKCY